MGDVDPLTVQLALVFIAMVVAVLILAFMALRTRRKALRLRKEMDMQKADALRAVGFMLQQLDYDAEVLGLLRHARNSREAGREVEFAGALDALMGREREMMARVDRAREFEGHLQKAYTGGGSIFSRAGAGDRSEESGLRTAEEIKSDIMTFIGAIGKIKAGDTKLLEEKIAFFQQWVESPDRQEIYKKLKALEAFLDKGDTTKLEELAVTHSEAAQKKR